MSTPVLESPAARPKEGRESSRQAQAAPLPAPARPRVPFGEGPGYEPRRTTHRRTALLCISTLAALAVGFAGWRHWPELLDRLRTFGTDHESEQRLERARFHTVSRGELRVVLSESGSLRAVRNHRILPTIQRQQLIITWLIEEGTLVSKGDLLVSFDRQPFEDQLRAKEAELEAARRELEVDEAAVEIEASDGKSRIAQAETRLEEARVSLRTYIDLDAPRQLSEMDARQTELRHKVDEARKAVSESRRQLEDGMFNEEEQRRQFERQLQTAQETQTTLERQLQGVQQQRRIFRTYDYPRTLTSREQAVANAELEVAKTRIGAENSLNQRRATVAQVREKIVRTEREIERLQEAIEGCDVHAPADGLVVYGDANMPHHRMAIQVGGQWFGGNAIMTIPDLSGFEIDVNIAEEYRGLLRPGVPARITIPAVSGLRLAGEVKEIAHVGQPRSPWEPMGPRAYRTAISVQGLDERMVTGMSALVEIIADEVRGVLTVPIDAVYNDGGQTVVFVRQGGRQVKREVEVGRRNIHMVEIVDGLEEGEQVSLAPPAELLETLEPGGPASEEEEQPPEGTPPGSTPEGTVVPGGAPPVTMPPPG